jgi:hypothetical protein
VGLGATDFGGTSALLLIPVTGGLRPPTAGNVETVKPQVSTAHRRSAGTSGSGPLPAYFAST